MGIHTEGKSYVGRAITLLGFGTLLLIAACVYLAMQQQSYSSKLSNTSKVANGAITTNQLSDELRTQLGTALAIAGALPVTDSNGATTSCDEGQVLSFSNGKIICVSLQTKAGDPITVTEVGPPGAKGDKGEAGTTGSNGADGESGARGTDGNTGTQGSKGDKGDKGDTGIAGITGATGAQGAAGVLQTALGNGLSGSLSSQIFSLNLVTDGDGGLTNSATGLSLTTACNSGQLLKWNGSSWACSGDNGTSYSAGTGLTLDGTSFAFDPSTFSTVSSVAGTDQVLLFDGTDTKRVSYNDLFGGVLGSLNYRGTWNANTNSPDLTSACGAGTKGYYYVVGTGGTAALNSITSWNVGDWVVCNGTGWQRVQTTNGVSSVFGRTGTISAANGDYTASQITHTPSGDLSGLTVQSALNELEAEKLSKSLASGLIFMGNGSGDATGVALSGDASLSNSGVLTLSNSAVTSSKIADGTITFADMASNSCGNGSVIKYNGSAWTCGSDNNSGTTYTAANSGANADQPIAVNGSAIGFSDGTSAGQYWAWNGTKWALTTASASLTIGTLDSQTKSANGAVIAGNTFYLQTADATRPGLVSTGTQTFGGAKTFSNGITVNSDATNGAVLSIGAASNSNVLPISIASASNQLASFTNSSGATTGFYTGSSSPEGVITANVGSYYTATDTGSMYVKTTGTGTTGWTVLGAGVAASYMQATLTAPQNTNISTGDHVKFNKVNVSAGSDITLNTSGGYSTTAGVSSLGRFTLKAGKTYLLNGVMTVSGNTSAIDTAWYNVTTSSNMGNGNSLYAPGGSGSDAGGGVNQVVFTPGTDTVVELRILGVAAVSQVGIDSNRLPSAFIQVIGGNAPVVGQTVDYINVNRRNSDLTVANGNDLIFNNVVSGNIPYNTTSGVFTLTAGKTYQLTANPSFINFTDTAGGYIQYDWVDSGTNNALIPSASGTSIPVNRNASEMDATVAGFIYTPTSNQTIKLRVTGSSGSAGLRSNYSLATIVQVGTSAATSISMNSLSGALASGTLDNAGYTQSWSWNNLTNGTGLDIGSTATGMTGSLVNISLTGNNAGNTGTLLSLSASGTSNAAAGLKVNVLGSGLALDITGGVAFRAGTDYTATGTQNDVTFGPNSTYRLNPNAALTVNGIAGGTGGKLLMLHNVSNQAVMLANQAGGSAANNRIISGSGSNVTLAADQSATLQYDGSSNRWRLVSTSGSTPTYGDTAASSLFSTTSSSYTSTGLAVSVPAAGTWKITYNAATYASAGAIGVGLRLVDGSNTPVTNSLAQTVSSGANAAQQVSQSVIVTTTGSQTFTLQMKTASGTGYLQYDPSWSIPHITYQLLK
ncbi:MAG TPA: collagen-like protein [Candidatus Saccharimonadales bacterium]|nr:collagen-like protein [Candidatus Saccharimonadales bacterium]